MVSQFVTVATKIPLELKERLEAIAKQNNSTVSLMTRRFVEKGIKEEKGLLAENRWWGEFIVKKAPIEVGEITPFCVISDDFLEMIRKPDCRSIIVVGNAVQMKFIRISDERLIEYQHRNPSLARDVRENRVILINKLARRLLGIELGQYVQVTGFRAGRENYDDSEGL